MFSLAHYVHWICIAFVAFYEEFLMGLHFPHPSLPHFNKPEINIPEMPEVDLESDEKQE